MPTTAHAAAGTFEEYAAAMWPSLYRRAYLLSGNHADSEDLAQQTLIKAHGAWSRVSRAASPDAYVRSILTNTFLSMKRPKGRRLELLSGENPPEVASPPIEGPEDRLALWPHVHALPPRQRAVVVLRYYEQLSEAEIADALGCSRGNVKSTAHRALQNLRSALDGSED
ncbi:MAG: SigE family RNA polymerase sigma factor [Nocardioides sp.]